MEDGWEYHGIPFAILRTMTISDLATPNRLHLCILLLCSVVYTGCAQDFDVDTSAAIAPDLEERFPNLYKGYIDEMRRILAEQGEILDDTTEEPSLATQCEGQLDRRLRPICEDAATLSAYAGYSDLFVDFGVAFAPQQAWPADRREHLAGAIVRIENAMRRAVPRLQAQPIGAAFDQIYGADSVIVFNKTEATFSLAVAEDRIDVGSFMNTKTNPLNQLMLFTHEMGHAFSSAVHQRMDQEGREAGQHPHVRLGEHGLDLGKMDTEGVALLLEGDLAQGLRINIFGEAEAADGVFMLGDELYRIEGDHLFWEIAGRDLETRFHDPEHGFRCHQSNPGTACSPYLMNTSIASLTTSEEFADMYLNWAFDSFADTPAGDARHEWMQRNMSDWLSPLGL